MFEQEQNKSNPLTEEGVSEASESYEEKVTEDGELSYLELQAERDKYLNLSKRMAAELDNSRKQSEKLHQIHVNTIRDSLLLKFLELVDDIERGIQNALSEGRKELSESLTLLHQRALNILSSEGVQMFKSLGETFSPELHEVIFVVPVDNEDNNKVVEVIQNGFSSDKKALRVAKIGLGKKTEGQKEESRS